MRHRHRYVVLLLVAAIGLTGAGTTYASTSRHQVAPPPLPGSMAAIGDSISEGFDACCRFGDHPEYSWSTGSAPYDVVASHYRRIQVANPRITDHAYNDSVSGAKAADTTAQAARAVRQGARYVTILVGANDVCTPNSSAMTPVAAFQAHIAATLSTLERGLPAGSHVFVSSIPNIYQLWALLHDDPVARLVWAFGGICQSMLSPWNTEADRQAVVRQEAADNNALAAACRRYPNCRWDNLATYAHPFGVQDVSRLDHFHPSRTGQAAIAAVTWAHSWWPASA